MIRIAILHPSRGRPLLARETFNKWINQSNDPSSIEYLIGLDDDDPCLEEYRQVFDSVEGLIGRFLINVTNSRNIPTACNNLGLQLSSTTELFIISAEDLDCFKGWDEALLTTTKDIDNFNDPKYIGVNDGLQYFGSFLIYVANRAFYKRLGYIIYPEYDGVYADNDIVNVATKLNGILPSPHLIFKHLHYSVSGGMPHDKIYDRHNNSESSARNYEVYKKRVERGFDL